MNSTYVFQGCRASVIKKRDILKRLIACANDMEPQ